MERLPITQHFQLGQSSLSVRSPPLQSPRTASVVFPSPNAISSYGIPSPEHSNYSLTSSNANGAANNSCLPIAVHSPGHYQNELMDPSIYPNSSMTAMMPQPTSSGECYKHDPTCSPSSCNMTSTSLHGSVGSPPSAVTPGTPQQQSQLGKVFTELMILRRFSL